MDDQTEGLPPLQEAAGAPRLRSPDKPVSGGFCPHVEADLTKAHSLGERGGWAWVKKHSTGDFATNREHVPESGE